MSSQSLRWLNTNVTSGKDSEDKWEPLGSSLLTSLNGKSERRDWKPGGVMGAEGKGSIGSRSMFPGDKPGLLGPYDAPETGQARGY